MIEPESIAHLKEEIEERLRMDRGVLDELRAEIRPLRDRTRRIQPRRATAISLVATDGGNNRIHFDPFLIQLVRVVDSSNNEYCLQAVTPTTDVLALSAKQFDGDGAPVTALGELMAFLGAQTLPQLSHMIHPPRDDRPASTGWVMTYRSLVEWAILFKIIRTKDFATDTLIVFDGLLRSKLFAGDKFTRMMGGIREAIEEKRKSQKRQLFLVGVAKHNAVLARYQLAMALEDILASRYPAYVEIPRELEQKAYIWSEWARGEDVAEEGGEANKFVGGKMFFVKFGAGRRDPVWPVDIFLPQAGDAQAIFGYLLNDATEGFPVAHYPRCLQKAHDNAALVDFDFDVLQDEVFRGLRAALGNEAPTLDIFRLRDADPGQRRYG
jgi:hypothetical protein